MSITVSLLRCCLDPNTHQINNFWSRAKHHSTRYEIERLFQSHQLIFSSIFTAPAWQGRPWWGRALPSSGCPRSASSWTASRTCGKIGACAASCARQTGKEGDRWFYFSLCIWLRQIIVTDLILFCKSFIATLLGAFVVGAVLPRQVPPYTRIRVDGLRLLSMAPLSINDHKHSISIRVGWLRLVNISPL